jgi:formylglycine-generating enzyme required for sulfatase activity
MDAVARQARVRELVDGWLDRAEPLASYLDHVEEPLRAEVEALCRDAQWVDTFFRERQAPAPLAPRPDRVGDCVLQQCIGHGAMGQVHRAREVRLQRDVAVKLVRAEFARHRDFLARFEHEARLLASVDHPGIVKLLSFGAEGDWLWFVMELVPGPDLAAALPSLANGGAARFDRAARIAAEVLETLAYVHKRGIVHRDVKPSNIVLDAADRPKLVDFGLARAAESPLQTHAGVLVGTPAYFSPELVARREGDRAAGDCWAVGVLLFQMLTGRLPFPGRTTDEVLANIAAARTPDPRAFAPDVPAGLAAITRRALQVDPAARYASAGAFAADLRRHLAGDDVLALRRAPLYRLQRHLWRRRRGYALAAVAAGVLAVVWVLAQQHAAATRIDAQLASLPPLDDLRARPAAALADGSVRAAALLLEAAAQEPQRVEAAAYVAAVRAEAERRHREGRELARQGAGSPVGTPLAEFRAPSSVLLAEGVRLMAEGRMMWSDLDDPAKVVASTWPVLAVRAPAGGAAPVRVFAIDPLSPALLPAAEGTTPCDLPVPPGTYRVVVGTADAFAECTRTLLAPGTYAIAPPLHRTADVQRGMLLVPAGPARVGQLGRAGLPYGTEELQHEAFYLDTDETTCGEWFAFMNATGAEPPWTWKDGAYDPAWERLPVVGVSVEQAQRYAEWRGKRLPTWIEWQYAARGPEGRMLPWGDDPEPLATIATLGAAPGTPWFDAARPVGSTSVDTSWCGARDLLGNAIEWTETAYLSQLDGVPSPVPSWRVRAGCSAATSRTSPGVRLDGITPGQPEVRDTGFRCCKSVRP